MSISDRTHVEVTIIESVTEGMRLGHPGRLIRAAAHNYNREKGGLLSDERVNELVTLSIKAAAQ